MVITFDHVSFKYIDRKILDQVSFSITDTDKVGVVGINGTGKTTLLKLMIGEEQPKSGTIIKSGGMRINYLPQTPHFPNGTILLEAVLQESTKEHPIEEYEAKAILNKLGLKQYDMVVDHLSGGELKRLALARALLTPCDILLLDEPTNHLDNAMILWLEKYLMKYKHGLIMVTHDRYFLQRVCTKMLELDFGKTYLYEANYEAFLLLKAERLENTKKEQAKLKSILKQEAAWMNRGAEARRTKSKSRIERFEKLSSIQFEETKEMSFSSKKTYLGKTLIEIKHGLKAFGDKLLFEDFSFSLQRTDIIGVVGDNGCGKSTLFKILMQQTLLDEGELILGQTLKIGYFSQNLELIDPEIRVIDYIKEEQSLIETLDGKITASELLDQFLFSDELKYSKVKMLSGGEKRRLQLVRVLMKNPNSLILDEPTNDLDIYTIEILENYIESFYGPVLIVSHDRYFLDKLCNKLFVFENQRIKEYNLSFSEYLSLPKDMEASESGKREKPKKNKLPAAIRNENQELNEEIPKLEGQLKALQEESKKDSTDYLELTKIHTEIQNLENLLDQKINRLLELEEQIEAYENGR